MKKGLSIVEARFPSLASHLDVIGKDPIAVGIWLKNNSLPSSIYELLGALWGVYDASTKVFSCLGVVYGGVTYLCGCFKRITDTLEVGQERGYGMPTYVPNVGQAMTLSALAFVMPGACALGELRVSWGGTTYTDSNGQNWVIGVDRSDFQYQMDLGNIQAEQLFSDVLTVTPAS